MIKAGTNLPSIILVFWVMPFRGNNPENNKILKGHKKDTHLHLGLPVRPQKSFDTIQPLLF